MADDRIHTEGIDEDGIVEDCVVETYYRPCEGVGLADGYFRVEIDDGGVNIETRIPISVIRDLLRRAKK